MFSSDQEAEIETALRQGVSAYADEHEAAARRLEAEAELHEATGNAEYAQTLRDVVAYGRTAVIEPLRRAAGN